VRRKGEGEEEVRVLHKYLSIQTVAELGLVGIKASCDGNTDSGVIISAACEARRLKQGNDK